MIKKVGIIGFGQMGSGNGQVSAAAEYKIIACDVSDDVVKRGLGYIPSHSTKRSKRAKPTRPTKRKCSAISARPRNSRISPTAIWFAKP